MTKIMQDECNQVCMDFYFLLGTDYRLAKEKICDSDVIRA